MFMLLKGRMVLVIGVTFVLGGVVGAMVYANRDIFSSSEICQHPDKHGCCEGEIYTDLGEQGFACCPESGGDCFLPI
jgi:hypothetical protein